MLTLIDELKYAPALREAALQGQYALFDYKKPGELSHPRRVAPLDVKDSKQGQSYLICEDLDNDGDVKSFRLDRMFELSLEN